MRSPFRLVPVTADDVRAVCDLRVRPDQEGFVAANAVSLAEAQFSPHAWFRAAYVDDVLVGFVMLHDDPAGTPTLWRLMVDARFQGRGYGRQVVAQVVDHLRARSGVSSLAVGARGGAAGPGAFYASLGFVPTGEVLAGDETVYRLAL